MRSMLNCGINFLLSLRQKVNKFFSEKKKKCFGFFFFVTEVKTKKFRCADKNIDIL